MTTHDTPQPAQDLQGEDWAGEMGAKWLANLDRFEGMIAPIGEALLAQAGYQSGERVLDLGCGGGATTLAIARTVGPHGAAVGLDISPDLIKAARARASASDQASIAFVCGDAATILLESAPFDRLFSRFGSMFFVEPVAAFAHLHSLLREGSQMDLAVWGPPRDNLWMMEMMGVVRSHIDIPPAIPRAPGPFAFEDLDYLHDVLAGSGFRDIAVTPHAGEQAVGGAGASPVEAADFVLAAMAVGRALADHGDAVRQAARDDLIALFESRYIPHKGVMMGCKAWLVAAVA